MRTQDTLREIEELQHRCEEFEGISLKLNWDLLRSGSGGGAEWLTAYEDELLAGFIGLYNFGGEVEVCGMVRPGYRRRGIFTSLWKRAYSYSSRGAGTVLLNAPASSKSAAGFLKTLPAEFHHAEYQMEWEKTRSAQVQEADSRRLPYDRVILRPAHAEESALLASLDSQGFGMSLEEAREMYEEMTEQDSQEHILIELDGQPAGKLRLWTEDGVTWIYGFTVDERFRGQGIGRTALLQTIERERLHGNEICLEVALHNPDALRLYESCGFVIRNTQNYYRYNG